MAQERITEELQQIHTQQSALALQLEEQTWADADAATAHLFEAVETDTAALRRSLARIQSVSRHAYEEAHARTGIEPQQTAAFRFYLRNEARLGMVRSRLICELPSGRATLSGVHRDMSPSCAVPSLTALSSWGPVS
jgi:hypothetical protein